MTTILSSFVILVGFTIPKTSNTASEWPWVSLRVHVMGHGWWANTPEKAILGTSIDAPIQAFEIAESGDDWGEKAFWEYKAYVKGHGWTSWMTAGQTAGWVNDDQWIGAIKVRLVNANEAWKVRYRVKEWITMDDDNWTNTNDVVWGEWKYDGQMAGWEDEQKGISFFELEVVKE